MKKQIQSARGTVELCSRLCLEQTVAVAERDALKEENAKLLEALESMARDLETMRAAPATRPTPLAELLAALTAARNDIEFLRDGDEGLPGLLAFYDGVIARAKGEV